MPDTHVPLDEEVEKRFDERFKTTLDVIGERPLFELLGLDLKHFLAQELAHLKHTICVEIEELKVKNHSAKPADKEEEIDEKAYDAAINDALSVPSLKESNNKCNCGNERLVERDTCEDCL